MKRVRSGLMALLLVFTVQTAFSADAPAKRQPREGLQAFNDLIGSWRATGTP